jgi:hypothetical protein
METDVARRPPSMKLALTEDSVISGGKMFFLGALFPGVRYRES